MSSISSAESSELFRRRPAGHIDVGEGEAALRTVGSGPPVLFVHGWPVTGATFRRLLPHLADHVTCHVVDLPGAGSSHFDADTHLSIEQHVVSVRRIVDALGADGIAVVGHDSGGMIARHALAGDDRLTGLGLIDTEPSGGVGWRFRSFIACRKLPGFGGALAWALARPAVRRNKWVFGDAFHDRSHLDGEFDEFFVRPLVDEPAQLDAAMRLLRSFEMRHVRELAALQQHITAPVELIWGEHDRFFPIAAARAMVDDFPDARLTPIAQAGLFSHEEQPAAVAAALLPVLTGRR